MSALFHLFRGWVEIKKIYKFNSKNLPINQFIIIWARFYEIKLRDEW